MIQRPCFFKGAGFARWRLGAPANEIMPCGDLMRRRRLVSSRFRVPCHRLPDSMKRPLGCAKSTAGYGRLERSRVRG